jgi:hypothetical protein
MGLTAGGQRFHVLIEALETDASGEAVGLERKSNKSQSKLSKYEKEY